MNSYKLLLKALLAQTYRQDKYNAKGKKNKTWLIFLVVGICCLPMIAIVCFMMYNTGTLVKQMNIVTEAYTFLITGVQVVILITSIIGMLSVLYFSKDIEFLLPLPIKNSTIYASKLTIVYINEMVTSAIMTLGILIPFNIGVGGSILSYVHILLVMIIAPLMPLLLGAIIAIPLMYIASFFRNKGAISTIFYGLLVMAIFGAYYYLIYQLTGNLENEAEMSAMLANLIAIISDSARYILPNFLLATLLNAQSFGQFALSLVLTLLINGALFVLAVLISSKVYNRTVSKQLENSSQKLKVIDEGKRKGKLIALIRSDIKRIMRDTTMGMMMVMQIVLIPLVLVFMTFQMRVNEIMEYQNLIDAILPVGVLAFMMFMGISTNTVATSAFSRENRSFYMFKLLPIDPFLVVKSKIVLAVAMSELSTLITTVVLAITLKLNVGTAITMFLGISLYSSVSACLQVYMDLMKPRLNWNNYNEAVKNNPSAIFSLLLGGVLMVVIGVIGCAFLIPTYDGGFPAWVVPTMWATIFVVGIAFLVVVLNIIKKNCHKYFEIVE